jgi:hypothetical protein
MHLAPAGGLGTGRRALFFAALTALPIVTWAAMTSHLVDTGPGESLLRHYGVLVRCLLAIPLFILAEGAAQRTVRSMVPKFISSGIVAPAQQAAFEQSLRDIRHLRDSSLPWIFVLGAIVAWLLIDRPSAHEDAMSWAVSADGTLGFGGWWYAYVARPILLALLLGWLWRILLVAYWCWRVGRIDLSFVPTHPDRAGGIAFVEKLPGAFALVTFAMSAMIASRWAHEITVHGVAVESYKFPAAAFVVIWTLLMLLPLLAFAPSLWAARKRAVPAYAALVGEQGRLVHQRWILHEPVADTPILDAPEIGPVADAATMYDAVKRMRVLPVGKSAIARILGTIALPMIVVAALQVPVGDVLLKLVKAVL